MFNSIVLDVVIGLLFIYLLYSLLATILSEMAATILGLRARNLKEAIDRMLNDEEACGRLGRLWDSMKLMKSPKNPAVNAFYNHPEIKYLGSSGFFRIPSNFKSSSFSKTIIALLIGKDPLDRNTLEEKLKNATITISLDPVKKSEEISHSRKKFFEKVKLIFKKVKLIINWLFDQKRSSIKLEQEEIRHAVEVEITKIYTDCNMDWEKVKPKLEQYLQINIEEDNTIPIGTETSKHLRSLWQESQGDMEKFKLLLEGWFEKTMVQTLEWYKRKIRWVTFVLGFLIAWFFYVDTFIIVKTLSTDKEATSQIVSMANSYMEKNPALPQTPQKLDSLLVIKKQLEEDITKANNILGLGGFPPDTVRVTTDPLLEKRVYTPKIIEPMLVKMVDDSIKSDFKKGKFGSQDEICSFTVDFSAKDKFLYFRRLFCHHFWGFLITAIAISLGAPFWFDLLNKIMKLRTSTKEDIKNPDESASSATVSPLNRVG